MPHNESHDSAIESSSETGSVVRKIIRDRKIVDDDYLHLDDESEVVAGTRITVSLERWQNQRAALKDAAIAVGVRLPNDIDVATIADQIITADLVAVQFPAFTDGRAYSQARVLREQHGYAGEIRALGDVLRDQVFYMHRCGINAFEIPDGQDINVVMTAFDDFQTPYQPACDSSLSVFQRRHAAADA